MAGTGTPADPASHTLLDDAQGLVFGSAMAAVGVTLLGHAGLVTGQTAGLALLIALWTDVEFGIVFFAINLPFYWLAWRRLGPAFAVKTFVAIALVSAFTLVQPRLFNFGAVEPLIPTPIDQYPCAHWRRPMDMMRQGCSVSSFQASQQWSTMSS
jgi:uncharacterized membrane-anchored protein YitT (DUF2179 family)